MCPGNWGAEGVWPAGATETRGWSADLAQTQVEAGLSSHQCLNEKRREARTRITTRRISIVFCAHVCTAALADLVQKPP